MRQIRHIRDKEKGFALCSTALGCGAQSIGLIGAGWGGGDHPLPPFDLGHFARITTVTS
jgi:hypothetical protein